MVQTCTKCSRVNPAEASYCYFDGSVLGNYAANGGPVNLGSQPFHNQFVFPSGQVCRNFDQLAVACQANWVEAIELLQQGYLEGFLGGLGRADLARAAREAARYPDRDRGLDRFLEQLPTDVLEPPRLLVEPTEINLGQLKIGEERQFELHLLNQGMRLLHGTVTVEGCVWLGLGEAPSTPQKHFQFGSEQVIPVRIRGHQLRANARSQEAQLTVESNGGNFLLTVKVEVSVKPFPEGVLAGARSPRQAAEKAKGAPKEAAAYFESGAVEKWYQENGWSYPVQGPAASGLGAVQQFFEALGLTPPPRVGISERCVALVGNVGAELRHTLEVKAQERRPVYAYGVSDQHWLKVGRPLLKGRSATIELFIPTVPDRPGETLQAQVTVTANGNQRFVVPVMVAVSGTRRPGAPGPVGAVALEETVDGGTRPPPVRSPARVSAGAVVATEDLPVAVALDELPEAVPVPAVEPPVRTPAPAPIAPPEAIPEVTADELPPVPPVLRLLLHLFPIALLFMVLFGFLVADLILGVHRSATYVDEESPPLLDQTPRVGLRFHEKGDLVLPDPSMRFGLVMLQEKDPKEPGKFKRLTYSEAGNTNNTCVRVDEKEFLFGQPGFGTWKERSSPLGKDRRGREREGARSVWVAPNGKVLISQTAEIVAGEQTRVLDTCLVRYLLENKDEKPHKVGLRFMLDTYIGANDGVPFTLPGVEGLSDTMREFNSPREVPDFIQALENEDLAKPGTVAHVQFRLGSRFDPPDRVTLGAWPNSELRIKNPVCRGHMTGWNVPVFPMKTRPIADSAVVIYWNEKDLKPGDSREVGFAYGLGSVSSSEGGKLGLTMGGSFTPGGQFTVTAYVNNPSPNQKLTLKLPEGFALVTGDYEQRVPPLPPGASSKNSPVTWKVRAGTRGTYSLKVESNTGISQTQTITIRSKSIFD